MDEPRTEYSSGKVNSRFAAFAKDFDFKVRPCIAGRPRTKGKVETQMKFIDEIHAYQGQLTLEELYQFIEKLMNRINQSFHQGSGKIPVFALEKKRAPFFRYQQKNQELLSYQASACTSEYIKYDILQSQPVFSPHQVHWTKSWDTDT